MSVTVENVLAVAASAVGGTSTVVAVVEADAVIQVDAVIHYSADSLDEAAELMQDAIHQLNGLDHTTVKELKAGIHEPWRLRLGGGAPWLGVQTAALCMTGRITAAQRDELQALASQPTTPHLALRMSRIARPHLLRWCPEHVEGGRLPAEVDYSTHALPTALASGSLVKMALVVQGTPPIEMTLLFDIRVGGHPITEPLRSAAEAVKANIQELLAEGKEWKALRRMLVLAHMEKDEKTATAIRAFMAVPFIVHLSAMYNLTYAHEDAARRYAPSYAALYTQWAVEEGETPPTNRAQFLRLLRKRRAQTWKALNAASKTFREERALTQLLDVHENS